MSFGSGSNPAGGEDPGDNGTSQDSLAVNAASEAGIVCVAAIGNDGYRRVTSVGAAETPPLLLARLMTKLVLREEMTQYHLSLTQDPEKTMAMITNGMN